VLLLMANVPTTVYANMVNFRVTPSEFVLEFGAHFPDRPGQAPPSDYRPDVRVVLPVGALQAMLQALAQAAAQRQQAVAPAATQQKQAPGFKGPGPDKDNP
jgi:hypothetical protein